MNDPDTLHLTPELVLRAYSIGLFPMSESADDPGLFWVEPKLRGIIPLETFHVPKRLLRTLRHHPFEMRYDENFDAVIEACGSKTRLSETWINQRIKTLYRALFDIGHCHTVECWREGKLVGGLYGVSLNGAFFGESMFSLETDASKIALVHLVERLIAKGFTLLDTQFITEHLKQFGTIEIPQSDYLVLLEAALQKDALF